MKRSFVVLVLIAALGGVAAAQSAPGEAPAEPPPPPPAPEPTPPPPPPPTHHAMMMAPEEGQPDRPEGTSFAIGVGYEFMTSLETPNIVSVRVRLPTGLQLEPIVRVSNQSTTTQMTPNPSTSTSVTELALGTLVRFPMIKKGRTDFELVGNALVDTNKTHPDAPNSDTRTTTFAIGWGIGIGFWLTHHWQLSFTATNPLFSYAKTSMDTGPGTSTSTSVTDFGLVFDPQVALMIHLYN